MGTSISVIDVERFGTVVDHRVILDQLFQETCDKVGNRLPRLFFVVAVNVHYCYILILECCLEVVYNDRSSGNLYQIFNSSHY